MSRAIRAPYVFRMAAAEFSTFASFFVLNEISTSTFPNVTSYETNHAKFCLFSRILFKCWSVVAGLAAQGSQWVV